MAWLVTAIFLLIYNVIFLKPSKGINLNLVDIGLSLLFLSYSYNFIGELFEHGFSIYERYNLFLFYFVAYLTFRRGGEKAFPLKGLSTLGFIFLFLFFSIVVYFGASHSYEELTTALSYKKGIGNISQIAMYCGLSLVLYIAGQTQLTYRKVLPFILMGIVAFYLKSKLLLIILSLSLLAKLLEKFEHKFKLGILSAIILTSGILITFFTPKSFEGRIEIAKIIVSNFKWREFWGVGLGGFDNFINEVFYNNWANNVVGEINQIAFNDYLQIFVELGYWGLIGMVLISFGLINGKSIFLGLAVIFITIVMFPLQYIESGLLWIVAVLALANEKGKGFYIPSSSLKVLNVILTSVLFIFTFSSTLMFSQWKVADNYVKNREFEEGISSYRRLEPYFGRNDFFYLKYGKVLKKNNNSNEAIFFFKKGLALSKSYELLINAGDMFYDIGSYSEARDYYLHAHLLRPEHLYPNYREVYCLINLNKEKEARMKIDVIQNQNFKSLNPYIKVMLSDLEGLLPKIE